MPRGRKIPDETCRQIFIAIETEKLSIRAAAKRFGYSVGSVSGIYKRGMVDQDPDAGGAPIGRPGSPVNG